MGDRDKSRDAVRARIDEDAYPPLTAALIKTPGFGPVVDEMFSRTAEDLMRCDRLPQARLEALAREGVILSVMTFEDFMNPEVHWIEPDEFQEAFNRLTGEEDMAGQDFAGTAQGMQAPKACEPPRAAHDASFTASDAYPAFISARRASDGSPRITVKVRGKQDDGPSLAGIVTRPGQVGEITMELGDFDQWLADAQRLCARSWATSTGPLAPERA